MKVKVNSPDVSYTDKDITAKVSYRTTFVETVDNQTVVTPKNTEYTFRTETNVPKLGVMLVGWGGNNGSTVTAGVLANRHDITWRTREGIKKPNYLGSLTQASTLRLGVDPQGGDVYIPFNHILPMVHPNDIVFDGWDISSANLADAMERAEVLEYDLQRQLRPYMESMKPRASIYFPDFIAANQMDRADNVLTGSKWEQMQQIRADIRDFKTRSGVDKVIVLWTANTERFADLLPNINDNADNLLEAIKHGESEIAPSQLFAVASILEGCSYINGSP